MANVTSLDVFTSILARSGFEVVSESSIDKQLRLVGRVDKEKFNVWLASINNLLKTSSKPGCPWSIDISKQYLLVQNSVRFAWRIIIQAEDIEASLEAIITSLSALPKHSAVELDSYLLPGYVDGQERGGQSATGKGATGILSAITGPRAADRRRAGGH